jgi:hypothetical protein
MNQDQMPGRIDWTGTGTFPPQAQGVIGVAQPTGLSATTQYGLGTPGVVPGESPLGGPATHPLPTEAEEGAIGLAPQHQTRESLLEAKAERLQSQLDEVRGLQSAQAPADDSETKPESGSGYDPNAVPEEEEEEENG